jgi:serine/threonine protein kinase
MVAVDTILSLLEELQVITAEQRARVLTPGDSDLDSVLATLGEDPAWWAPEAEADSHPTLTFYQTRMIRKYAEEPRLLRVSLRISNVLLLRQIGKGGMGLVYQGWDLRRQRFVALKRMRKDGSRALLMRFRKERKVLQKLRHPRIVRLLEFIRGKRSETLVMQYLDGRTLDREISAHKRVPWLDVVRWAVDILDALRYVHSRNVIHRDIKPTNIMLHQSRSGARVAVLLDVGLAKNLDLGNEAESVSVDHTVAGQLLGTFLYMAPEQWGAQATFASDVYGLGATLFHALTGVPPFTGKEPELGRGDQPMYVKMCRAHTDLKPPRLRDRLPNIPEELDHLVFAMLEKDPTKRATIDLLLAAFRRLLTRIEEEEESATASTPRPAATRVLPRPVATPSSPTPAAVRKPTQQVRTVRQLAERKAQPGVIPSPDEAPLPDEHDDDDSLPLAIGGLASAFWGYLVQERESRPSTIFASPGEQLRRAWHRFTHQAADWFTSLTQPHHYPGRFLVTLLLVLALGGGIYWLFG